MNIEKNNLISVTPDGRLSFKKKVFKCAIGKSGVTERKREGDGATPVGTFPIREIFYRADRIAKPKSQLAISELKQNDGWSDDPENPNYNKKVSLLQNGRAEHLWRTDHAYDIIVVIGYNDAPIRISNGSAIFMHLANDGYQKTRGCIALKYLDLLDILEEIPSNCFIRVFSGK